MSKTVTNNNKSTASKQGNVAKPAQKQPERLMTRKLGTSNPEAYCEICMRPLCLACLSMMPTMMDQAKVDELVAKGDPEAFMTTCSDCGLQMCPSCAGLHGYDLEKAAKVRKA